MLASATLALNPGVAPDGQHLLDRHDDRKHGRGAYCGQTLI